MYFNVNVQAICARMKGGCPLKTWRGKGSNLVQVPMRWTVCVVHMGGLGAFWLTLRSR